MTARSCWGLLVLVTTTSLGCAMCASPFDYDYAAFGGIRPRTDMRQGRVGGLFSANDAAEIPVEYAIGEPEFGEMVDPDPQSPQSDHSLPFAPDAVVPAPPSALESPPESLVPASPPVAAPPRSTEPPPDRHPPAESVPEEPKSRRPHDDLPELPEID